MKLLADGILLPQDLLNSMWFQAFAAFVAFNTVIYVGLTLSKMMVWPRQARLRAMAAHLPATGGMRRGGGGGHTTPALPPEGVPATWNLRTSLIANDAPIATAGLGALIIVLNAILFAAHPSGNAIPHIVGLVLGVAFIGAAQVMSRARLGQDAMSWSWAAVVVATGIYLASPLTSDHATLALGFLLIVTTAFPAVLVSWQPFIVTGVLMFIATAFAIFATAETEPVGWLLLGLAVLGVGALLLRTRLTSITALEEAEALSQRLATTDPLTGLLSQSGMESILPRFVGTAYRTGDSVCVMYITVPELNRAVREYGRDYGNAVIGAVADAVRDTVREGDLVARWRSAGFLVAGFGLQPDSRMLTARVQQQVTSSGVDLGKWPIIVRAGTAAGSADEHAVAVLIGAAEADSEADADAAEGVRTLA